MTLGVREAVEADRHQRCCPRQKHMTGGMRGIHTWITARFFLRGRRGSGAVFSGNFQILLTRRIFNTNPGPAPEAGI